MLQMLKTRQINQIKGILVTAISFVLLFSFMLNLAVSANVPGPGMETTAVLTEVPTKAPDGSIDHIIGEKAQDDVNIDEKLKETLTAFKKIFVIDDKIYTNFQYNYNPSYDGGLDSWYFNWYSNDGSGNISASVLGNGKVLYYSKYSYDEKTQKNYIKLAALTKAQAKTKSDAFMKKLLGDEFKNYRLYYQNLNYPSDRYNLIYVLTKNGYDCPNYQLYIDIDKMTGEIMSFSDSYNYYLPPATDIAYQDASKVISREDALKSYMDNIGLELLYTSRFDYQTKEITVYPIYTLKNIYNQYISAVDGSLIELDGNFGYVPSMAEGVGGGSMYGRMATAESAADTGVYFSQAELAEMAKAKDFISADNALDIIIKAFDLDIDISEFQVNSSLNPDYMHKDKYYWNISLYRNTETMYENYYATVNAKNGTVINYSGYSYVPYYGYDGGGAIKNYTEPQPLYTYEEVEKIVMDKIKELCPYDLEENFELMNYAAQAKEGVAEQYCYFDFARMANGIRFDSNNLYIHFDNLSGKITSYGLNWYDDVKFPKLDKIISPEKALDSMADFYGYNIYYIAAGLTDKYEAEAVLAYKFDAWPRVDPYTGKCVDWNFEEAKKPETLPDYKDLDGHWSEAIVEKLTDNGIYVWGGDAFDPDKNITTGEFLDYLSFYIYNPYYFNQAAPTVFVASYYNYTNIQKYRDDLDKATTKQEAAKIICELMGYGEIGKHYEIFVYPFADGECDDEYRGYVAILQAFGFLVADEDGSFNGTDELTRADAALIIYNIIMTINK